MIFTSYFAKLRALTAAGIIPISIALYEPKWYEGRETKILAPNPGLLSRFKLFHNEEAYVDEFRNAILANLDPHEVAQILQGLAGKGREFALLCYEKPTSFCHRHLVAEWFNENGIPCEEWKER